MSNNKRLYENIYILLFMLIMFSGNTFLLNFVMPFCVVLCILLFFTCKVKNFPKLAIKTKNNSFTKFLMILIIIYLFVQLFYSFRAETTFVFFARFIFFYLMLIFVPKPETNYKVFSCIRIYSFIVAISIIIDTLIKGYPSGGLVGNYQYAGMMMVIGFGVFLIEYYQNQNKFNIIGLLFTLLALLTSGKRSFALIAFFAYFLIYIFTKKNAKKKKFVVISLIMLLFAFLAYLFVPPVQDAVFRFLSTGSDSTLSGRSFYWDVAKDIYNNNKIFGIGMGCYRFYFDYKYRLYGNMQSFDAHNIYFQMAAELGLFGEILFLLFFGFNLISTFKLFRNTYIQLNKNDYCVLLYSLFMQLWFLIYGLSGNPLYGPDQCFMYFSAVAMMYSIKTTLMRRQ